MCTEVAVKMDSSTTPTPWKKTPEVNQSQFWIKEVKQNNFTHKYSSQNNFK